MKIIINAFQYAPTITGTDRMAHNFLKGLQEIDKSNKYIIICSGEDYTRSAITASNFKVISPASIPGGGLAQRAYNKFWRISLPVKLILQRADVYLSFHNMNLPPRRLARRMIAFNLDLIPLILPEYAKLLSQEKNRLRSEYLRVSRIADLFISISQFSKEELCTELNVPPERVEVVYLGADHSGPQNKESQLTLPNNYILTIGGTEPRKNVDTVVRAFSQLPQDLQEQFPLVIIGGEWHGISLDKFKSIPNVVCLGYVKDAELPGLYKNAKSFIFASEYEGFGFTILEAMASGTPVITSNSSSLAEVAGEAALLFDAHDSDHLAKHMMSLIGNEELSAQLIRAGEQRVAEFSWDASTRKLHNIIVRGNPLEPDQ